MDFETFDNYRKKFRKGETEALYIDVTGQVSFFIDHIQTSVMNPNYGVPNEEAGKWLKERNLHPLTMDEQDFYIFRSQFG